MVWLDLFLVRLGDDDEDDDQFYNHSGFPFRDNFHAQSFLVSGRPRLQIDGIMTQRRGGTRQFGRPLRLISLADRRDSFKVQTTTD